VTENALLLVQHPELQLKRVGGLTVIERHAWTAHRAGLKRLYVGLRKPADSVLSSLRLPKELELRWSERDGQSVQCEPPYIILSGAHFLRVETLRYVAEHAYGSPVSLEDAAGAAVLQVVPFRSEKIVPSVKQPLPEGASCYVELPAGRDGALSWLMQLGAKAQDGFMAKNFDRHISLAVSRLLLETPVSPNMMTIFSTLIGVYGATLFLEPSASSRMSGAILVWLHSVLDGCDGELARMRFQQSAYGATLDFWGDNLVHVALFGCMAVGFSRADASVLPLIAGAMAVVATVGSALLVDRSRTTAGVQQVGTGPFAKLAHMLAARDFIYLLLVLAYIDRTYEFLWMTAIGSMLFFALMMSLGGRHEQASQPYPPR
jgi:phosphatidylglycerophosphate synthase